MCGEEDAWCGRTGVVACARDRSGVVKDDKGVSMVQWLWQGCIRQRRRMCVLCCGERDESKE